MRVTESNEKHKAHLLPGSIGGKQEKQPHSSSPNPAPQNIPQATPQESLQEDFHNNLQDYVIVKVFPERSTLRTS